MDDCRSPSMAKENIAAAILSANRRESFEEPSCDIFGLTWSAGACPASRGASSSRELDAMFGVLKVKQDVGSTG